MRKFFVFIIVFTLILASVIYFTFTYGTNFLSSVIADIIPTEVQQQIGENTLKSMDAQSFEKTALPTHVQKRIMSEFYKITQQDSTQVKLLFRNAPYPNAFALPGNFIVILDSLVKLSNDSTHYYDILGVLSHEAGHLHYKHSLRLIIKAGLTGVIIGYVIGDFSSFLATVTHQLLSLSYSRQFEEEADDYAIQILRQNKISTLPLANILEKLSNISQNSEVPEFLSTHPVTKERVKKLKENNF
ncbi:MAG: M48 family metallopeptidase [Bacteroidia bacterium]|nr:M48 family metallopeptidase [Bacteroidia bacterium]